MQIKTFKTRVFRENENLIDFVLGYIKKVPESSVVVITSKIVALSEGRTVVFKDKKQKVALIKKESDFALETKHAWLTVKDGSIMASAGIDESNANGKLILLPKDSFKSATMVCNALKKKFKLKKFGVIITDSRTIPFRAGTVGMTLGYAGIKGVRDYRNTPDIFGRMLKISRTDVVDSLASAAVLPMGEGREQMPIALVTDAPVEFVEKVDRKELSIDLKDDLYMPLFGSIFKK